MYVFVFVLMVLPKRHTFSNTCRSPFVWGGALQLVNVGAAMSTILAHENVNRYTIYGIERKALLTADSRDAKLEEAIIV